jgi:hypothetical protein
MEIKKTNIDDVRSNLRSISPANINQDNDLVEIQSQKKEQVELDGRIKFFNLRNHWSWFIFGWITSIIVFHITFVILIGCDVLHFSKQDWIIGATIIEGLLEITGMGWVVVKFLYPKSTQYNL